MAFTTDDITKLAASTLAAGVMDSNTSAQWYEKFNAWGIIVDPDQIWSDMSLVKDLYAKNFSECLQHSLDNPHLIGRVGINDDGTFNDDTAIRMTPVAGTNNSTYIAYNDYNDPSSGKITNWIQPQLVPRPNGFPSAAYQASIWAGKPSEGNLIFSSAGYDGNFVSHFWSPALGLLLIAPADAPPSAAFPSTDIYVTGFIYTGATGGGGSVAGEAIVLEDQEDDKWRIRIDYPYLRMERRDLTNSGDVEWNTYASIGDSVKTDGLVLTQPYDIKVDLANQSLNGNEEPEYREVFRVNGVDNSFVYGDTRQETVFETKAGGDLKHAKALTNLEELEVRPLRDIEHTLSSLPADAIADRYFGYSVNMSLLPSDFEWFRVSTVQLSVLEILDDNGDPVDNAYLRMAVYDRNTFNLLWENVTSKGMNAGLKNGALLEVGEHRYPLAVPYTDRKGADIVIEIELQAGYQVTFEAGEYDGINFQGDAVKQLAPWSIFEMEYLERYDIIDTDNFQRKVAENYNILVDNGISSSFVVNGQESVNQLIGIGEHVTADRPVVGNYEGSTFIATGSDGLQVLVQDDTSYTELLTEGDRGRLEDGRLPTFFQEVTEFELDLSGVFTSELNDLNWDVVNSVNFRPLIRVEGSERVSYRSCIKSTIDDNVIFQENMTRFQFRDGFVYNDHSVVPTIDPEFPEYTTLKLPREKFTINRESPRKIVYQFSQPIKLYGYYKDPTDTNDPVNTGTFVPSIKSNVYRVFEETVVSGSDLEERVDEIQGGQEWQYATVNGLSTLHADSWGKMWLADKDGEALIFSDSSSIYTDQDPHQWIFATGQEAYFELNSNQASYKTPDHYEFDPVVVHVPYAEVNNFEVTFCWGSGFFSTHEYGTFTLYVDSGGRGYDIKIVINIPKNASLNWRFRRRRDGSYSYIATPMNTNLASIGVSGQTLTDIPIDENPPILIDGNLTQDPDET